MSKFTTTNNKKQTQLLTELTTTKMFTQRNTRGKTNKNKAEKTFIFFQSIFSPFFFSLLFFFFFFFFAFNFLLLLVCGFACLYEFMYVYLFVFIPLTNYTQCKKHTTWHILLYFLSFLALFSFSLSLTWHASWSLAVMAPLVRHNDVWLVSNQGRINQVVNIVSSFFLIFI